MDSAAFLADLLGPGEPAWVAAEDFDGPHGDLLRAWQDLGFIGREPGANPTPGCPHCDEGVPYRLAAGCLCPTCASAVDPRHLLAWPVRREAVLEWVARRLRLRGGIRRLDTRLWQLGTGTADGAAVECFAALGGPPSEAAKGCLGRYVRLLVLHGSTVGEPGLPGRWVPLARVFAAGGARPVSDLTDLIRARGRVRFDPDTGVLWVGSAVAGEVSVGSREWALLACLAEQLDQFVPYRDLKREVLTRTGGRAETDEATFCQKLKSRIKEKLVSGIDRLLVTSNKADGYRLRREV